MLQGPGTEKQLIFFTLIIFMMNITLNIIIESKNTGETLYL